MPRNISGVFALPPGSIVSTGDTILPTQHNTPLNDIASDLNLPRPIVAGGTGADSAPGALVNLGLAATAAEINTVADGITATAAQLNAVPQLAGRNAIINGNFEIWQRGVSSSTLGYVTADRWANRAFSCTSTQTQQFFTPGQTDVPNEPEAWLRTVVSSITAAPAHFAALQQRIENVRTFAGQTATLTFYAKADATRNIAVELAQSFGSSFDTARTEGIGVTTIGLTTAWQRFEVEIAVTSLLGEFINPSFKNYLEVNFFFSASADLAARTNSLTLQAGTFDIAQVQLERGAVATPFEMRPIGQELALCQRYYSQISVRHRFPSGGAGQVGGSNITFPVLMREAPASSFISSAATLNVSAVNINGITADGAKLDITASGAGDTFRQDIYGFSAEL